MKKTLTVAASWVMYSLPVIILSPMVALAQNYGLDDPDFSTDLNLGNRDLRASIASIINVFLSVLGIIAVVIILLGGFKWMTAQGNEEKTDEAKKLIGAGVIGLVIILAAYAIASFVLSNLNNATGAGAGV